MTMLLENRSISMILTVPDIKKFISPLSHSVDNLDQQTSLFNKNSKPPSIPIYHGSIIRIEQHDDNENTSDLIIRVPNFHHLSLPSITISTTNDQFSETESQKEIHIKRRAPICPILNSSLNQNLTNNFDNSNLNQSEINSRLPNTKRFVIGLRNLSRAFTSNCKTKSSSNINEITFIPVLPDVEVITEIPISSKKHSKNFNLTSKILFIKRKHFKIKRKQTSSNLNDSQTNSEDKTNEDSDINLSIKDNEIEQSKQILNPENEQQTISQLVSNIPISLVDHESSSTHRYCTISGVPLDSQLTISENIFQSNRTDTEQTEQYDNNNIEEKFYIVHPNGDTYSETYEVTYELDPEYQQFFDNDKQEIYLPDIKDQSSIKFNLDSNEYEHLSSTFTNYLPIITSNNRETNFEQQSIIPKINIHSVEDLSQINNDQTSTFSQENNQILSINDTPIIDEDYQVILQVLKRALQIDDSLE